MKKLLVFLSAAMLFACDDGPDGAGKTPSIAFANEEGVYQTKVGRELLIEPVVSDAVRPEFVWMRDGDVVGRQAGYTFAAGEAGQYIITFRVEAANGAVERELRVDVAALAPPMVELPDEGGYIDAIAGGRTEIAPVVTSTGETTYKWELDGVPVATTASYIFEKGRPGDYQLALTAGNGDGKTTANAVVRVREMPGIEVCFDGETLFAPAGRAVVVAPYSTWASGGETYGWRVNGIVQAGQTGAEFRFTPVAACTVEATVTDRGKSSSATIEVIPVAAEGTYRRQAAGGSSQIARVFEYLPAPGQFINDGHVLSSADQACEYAFGRLAGGGVISLGALGGRVVAGFDHSVANTPGADIAIRGNAHAGSSEPGVVWVMQDENGDGLPNDTWYELRGSETGKTTARQRQSITYFKPAAARRNVRWIDGGGNSGFIDINTYHVQSSYYPLWASAGSYTLRGTQLASRTVDSSGDGSYWVNGAFEWGYADNIGSDYADGEVLLDIDNAVYQDGTPVALQYIDFVKVQSAVNAKAGWIGEVSTEILSIRDMGL